MRQFLNFEELTEIYGGEYRFAMTQAIMALGIAIKNKQYSSIAYGLNIINLIKENVSANDFLEYLEKSVDAYNRVSRRMDGSSKLLDIEPALNLIGYGYLFVWHQNIANMEFSQLW